MGHMLYRPFIISVYLMGLIFWGLITVGHLIRNGKIEIEFYVETEDTQLYGDLEEPEVPGECTDSEDIGYQDVHGREIQDDCDINCYACVHQDQSNPIGPCKTFPGLPPEDYICGGISGVCRWYRYK